MKERVEFRIDSFIDYTGIERKFVMAAVSLETDAEVYEENDCWEDEATCAPKKLSLGVSVCRPDDEFDEELGKTIALGKARKSTAHTLFSTDTGLINRGVVNALLDQEVAFFKQCPGKYIAGYNVEKEAYEEGCRMVEAESNLSDEERVCLNTLLTSPDARVDVIYDIYNYYKSGK